jgi:hypothetical protein
MLDLALMTADDRLAEKLAALHGDHRFRLEPPAATLIARLGLGVMVGGGVLWWFLS